MRIVYNEQLYSIAHYIQCVTVLLIVYNVQNVLHTVDTEHEMLRIVYNAQTVQIEYDIYMDATFRVCPPPYLTIMGDFHGFVIPLVHVLMVTKTVAHYRHVFQEIQARVRALTHHRWRPGMVITDFEIALQTAVRGEFPATAVCACYFHFTQSLWRKIQDLGLAVAYRQNRHIKELVS